MCTQKIEVVEWYLPECIIDSKVNRQQLPEKKHIFCFTYYIYRPDSQCCGLRHWPYGQCRFFPFFLVLVAWANCGFRVNYGQCRFCTAIGPEVANAAPLLPRGCLEWMLQYYKRHWPTLLKCTSRYYFPVIKRHHMCNVTICATAPYVRQHHMCRI